MPILQRSLRAARSSRKLKLEQLESRICLSATLGDAESLDVVHLAAQGALPLEQTFQLASHPDASKTIYLDFNGHVTRGTAWNRKVGRRALTSAAWSLDEDRTTWSVAERRAIQQIWAAVAEDFAPFDVNVTTRYTPASDLMRSSTQDSRWGIRVVIGTDPGVTNGSLGVAYMGSFNWSSDTPAFVFTSAPQPTALAISHEVGHTLGLRHDGLSNQEYYAGAAGWGPIMGNPLSQTVTQWSRGEYQGATNTEDDLAIIGSRNGFGFQPDDVGDTLDSAQSLRASAGTLSADGVISQPGDRDVFRFTAQRGPVTIRAEALSFGANLNARLQLVDSQGNLVAEANQPGTLDAGMNVPIPQNGTYYVIVDGAALETEPHSSAYGSLGHYHLTVAQSSPRMSQAVIAASHAAASQRETAPPSERRAVPTSLPARLVEHRLANQHAKRIRASAPSTVTSVISAQRLEGIVRDVTVQVDIRHDWIGDLELYLVSPSGTRVPLALRHGGNADRLSLTFSDAARQSIANTSRLSGAARPVGRLHSLRGERADGEWKLVVRDRAYRDGGYLKGWSLTLRTEPHTHAMALASTGARVTPATAENTGRADAVEPTRNRRSARRTPRRQPAPITHRLAARDAAIAALTRLAARRETWHYFDGSDASICSSNRGT